VVEREHSGSQHLDRPLRLGVAAAAAVLALSACTGSEPTGAEQAGPTAGTQTSGTLDPGLQSVLPQGALTEDPGANAQEPAKDDGDRWGTFATATDACAAVAGSVAAVTLAPLNLLSGVDEGQAKALESELGELARHAPSDLHGPLSAVRAEIGRHDRLEEFDYEGFQAALDPLDDWLDANCSF
jgi:hypothetical protein